MRDRNLDDLLEEAGRSGELGCLPEPVQLEDLPCLL